MKTIKQKNLRDLLRPIQVALLIFIFFGCDTKNNDLDITPPLNEMEVKSEEQVSRTQRPLILGNKMENPFSVENMSKALDAIKSSPEQARMAGVNPDITNDVTIKTTDLYVRFLPKDSLEYQTLISDTTLVLFPFPLDYEIQQNGDYYVDETVEGNYQWQYTTVKPDFVSKNGIKYEVLSELFIPENSEYYTEEIISSEDVTGTQTSVPRSAKSKKQDLKVMDDNFVKALLISAFEITGNSEQLRPKESKKNNGMSRVTIKNCTNYRFLWKRWTSCDYVYYPDGYIKVNTPKGDVGVKGVKVKMWRWFYYSEARTNADGYYISGAKWNSIWIGNNIDYHIIFDGQNGDNNWTFSKSLLGALCLWTNWHDAGFHSPNGHSVTFDCSSDSWGRCILNNAIYDYINYARQDGIALPPENLDIASKHSDSSTSSAPLLKNHFNFSLVYGFGSVGAVAEVWGYSLLGWALPDLILRYNKNMNRYNDMNAVVWHELTHASQLSTEVPPKKRLTR